MQILQLSPQVDAEFELYLALLVREREGFLALHAALLDLHPSWIPAKDARLALVAKPVNFLLNAVINIRVTQKVLSFPQWWAANISPEFSSEEATKAAMFDLQTFYRFAFVQLLLSNIEHGFRAIQPKVVSGLDAQADADYWKVYTTLFRAALPEAEASRHINTWAFLATLRNTIHNNGTFFPRDHKERSFTIAGREYKFRDRQVVEAFSLNDIVVYMQEIRAGIADLMKSARVSDIPFIEDFAYTPLSGTPASQYGAP